MFYQEEFTPNRLRFGDIIEGYVESLPKLDKPFLEHTRRNYIYEIESFFPKFSVIITPCCNIEEKILSLSPLCQIPPELFKNPYFIEDFTILNREIEAEKTFPPEVWNNKFDNEERQRRMSQGKQFTFNYFFFFEENDLFPEYTIKYKDDEYKTRYYVIDFRHIYPIRCEGITRNKIGDLILESKCLELTPFVREELRNKLSYYFGRAAEEDELILNT